MAAGVQTLFSIVRGSADSGDRPWELRAPFAFANPHLSGLHGGAQCNHVPPTVALVACRRLATFRPSRFLIWWRRVHDDHKDETRDRPPGKLAYSKNQTSVMVDFAKIIIPIVTAFFVIYAAALRSPQLQSANQMLFFGS